MAANFKIHVHVNNSCLHLRLSGDFDGSSAFELLNALSDHCDRCKKVTIETEGIKRVHNFGRLVLTKNIEGYTGKKTALQFTGRKAARFKI